jgi:hypothetical protein
MFILQGATVLLFNEALAQLEVRRAAARVKPIGVPEVIGEQKSREVPWKRAAKQ